MNLLASLSVRPIECKFKSVHYLWGLKCSSDQHIVLKSITLENIHLDIYKGEGSFTQHGIWK